MEDVRGRPRLRSSSTRYILLPRVQTGQRSFAYSGPAVWNGLPPASRENVSLATFKTKLKTYLFRYLSGAKDIKSETPGRLSCVDILAIVFSSLTLYCISLV